ncbi:MAG: hypothetical protein ACLVJ6_03435 [Merdibacter sp.]
MDRGEILLFVLVGAAVDIHTMNAGTCRPHDLPCAEHPFPWCPALSVAYAAQPKERLFCVIAYLPKATVQAAIGSLPLSMDWPAGRSCFPSLYCPSDQRTLGRSASTPLPPDCWRRKGSLSRSAERASGSLQLQ